MSSLCFLHLLPKEKKKKSTWQLLTGVLRKTLESHHSRWVITEKKTTLHIKKGPLWGKGDTASTGKFHQPWQGYPVIVVVTEIPTETLHRLRGCRKPP